MLSVHKGIKILGKVLSGLLLTLIILPAVAALLLEIPAVQNAAVHGAARMLSRRLDTRVEIDRVRLSVLSRLRVEGLYVEDYQRDTLLYVRRLDAYVTGFGLTGGGVELSRGRIEGARLHLHETPSGEMNIKQLVARLSDPDRERKGNFRLSVRRASILDMEFCLEKLQHRDPPYGIDFGHLCVEGLTARIEEFTIDGQTIYTSVETLRARERSGFRLDHLSGKFYLTGGCLGFGDAAIVTERSHLRIPCISLVGNEWTEYRAFTGEVELNASLRNSTLSTDDLAYFAPRLRDRHITLSDADLEVEGVVSDLRGRILNLTLDGGTTLAADFAVRGLPDFARSHLDIDLHRLTTSAEAASALALAATGRPLPPQTRDLLAGAGKVTLDARLRGTPSSFSLTAGATTAVGRLDGSLSMAPRKNGLRTLRGDLTTRNLRLGDLLGRRDLWGEASLAARIDGTVGRGHADAAVQGEVTGLEFNGYRYDSVRLDGRLRDRAFEGTVSARDRSLDFDFSGAVSLNDTIPAYDFTLDLRRADLAAMRINRRDSVSVLAARVRADARGRSLDDLDGSILVTDARYDYNDRRVEGRRISVTGRNSATSKLVELRSDFADATFRSRTSYRTVIDYLRRSALRYLPLPGRGGEEQHGGGLRTGVADDYSLLSVDIHRITPLVDAITQGLQVAEGSSLRLLFNPASDQLSLTASSEYVERGNLLATRLSVNASNRRDSLVLYASAEDLYAGMLHLPRLSVNGGARGGRVQLATGFTDSLNRASGLLTLRAEVDEEGGPHGRTIDLRLLPSHIRRGDKTWNIFARGIRIDTAQVVIDRFTVVDNGQDLLLDGIASRSLDDSLTLRLRNFDIAPFTQIANRMGYTVEGRTSGEAKMKSVLRGGEVTADILFDSLRVNAAMAPPLRLTSRWDFARSRAGIAVTDRRDRDTLVRGFFDPSQMRYYARLRVDSLQLGLLDPVLAGVISGTRGTAAADLTLQGRRRDADLTGEIRVSDLRTTVDFSQTAYRLPAATMRVEGNRFRASNATVYDSEGNTGRLDLELDLSHLSNIAYDLTVAPREMLVLDTSAEDNDLFYGRVYASGLARIRGDKGGVEMDIEAATERASTFFMPLSGKSNISYADFVHFERSPEVDTTDRVQLKKLLFERRREARTAGGGQTRISMALDVRPNVEVELLVSGNAVKARGEGMLNLQINPRTNTFEMYGDYRIAEGSYMLSLQNIINKRFLIEEGSTIQWTGSPMDALLDIDALYKLKASLQPLLQGTADGGGDRSVPVECVIHLGERLTNPDITFDVRVPGSDPETQTVVANALSTPETVDTQFAYLLLFNSFMAENSASSNMGSSVSAATGLEFVSSMVSNLLSNDDYNIVLRYRPKSELAGDEVDFGLSKSLIDDRLIVEVEGNYLIDNKQAVSSSMSNFMGEAYVTYLIDRAGTLKLKVFTQTIDRFDENQGLQETGLGLYYKEDFDNFRDFRRRVRERFSNKARKARREARRQHRAELRAGSGPDSETEHTKQNQ